MATSIVALMVIPTTTRARARLQTLTGRVVKSFVSFCLLARVDLESTCRRLTLVSCKLCCSSYHDVCVCILSQQLACSALQIRLGLESPGKMRAAVQIKIVVALSPKHVSSF